MFVQGTHHNILLSEQIYFIFTIQNSTITIQPSQKCNYNSPYNSIY